MIIFTFTSYLRFEHWLSVDRELGWKCRTYCNVVRTGSWLSFLKPLFPKRSCLQANCQQSLVTLCYSYAHRVPMRMQGPSSSQSIDINMLFVQHIHAHWASMTANNNQVKPTCAWSKYTQLWQICVSVLYRVLCAIQKFMNGHMFAQQTDSLFRFDASPWYPRSISIMRNRVTIFVSADSHFNENNFK